VVTRRAPLPGRPYPCGGPVATVTEADRLVAEQALDAALVDFNLRGGERPDSLMVIA
jgi:hypothetical protein